MLVKPDNPYLLINGVDVHPLHVVWFGDGPNTVSESMVSLSEFFCPRRVPGKELSEFLSAYYLCAKANSPSFFCRTHRVCHRTQ